MFCLGGYYAANSESILNLDKFQKENIPVESHRRLFTVTKKLDE